MVTDNRGSQRVDPLQGHSLLFLFPEPFEVSEVSFDHQLGSVHDHLKSTAPNKLREQAKNIVHGSSKNLSTKTTPDRVSMKKSSEVLPVVAEINPRERRPGLGRKRARFSLKPNSSQSDMSIEPTLDIKNLKDPAEFFKAYETYENAKKEIQRQRGAVLSDSELQNTSVTDRPRRPGMMGHNKRRAIYKHLYSSDASESKNNVICSQEQFNSSILSPDYHNSQEESGREMAGSISAEVDKVDEILDELLSYNGEELEGDRAMSILQKRLHIKPIELQKLNLPDFPDMPKINSITSGKLRLSSITQMKHKRGSESSNPQKSPFASLPSLNRRISLSSPSNDPFSAHDIDLEPVTNPSRDEQVNNGLADMGRQYTQSPQLEKDGNVEVSKTHTSKIDGALHVVLSPSHLPGANEMEFNMGNGVVNDKLAVHDADGSTQENEANVQDEMQVENELQEMAVPVQPCLDAADIALDNDPEDHNEINQEQSSKIPLDKNHRAKSQPQKAPMRSEIHRRKSLAGAGTKWESEVRRSTRIKCRPLEYWNGERLIYGRIHKSLPTVIGLKYASPGKSSENRTLKVKSYVSDKHKELLKFAALH